MTVSMDLEKAAMNAVKEVFGDIEIKFMDVSIISLKTFIAKSKPAVFRNVT